MNVLIINPGSSSIRFALFQKGKESPPICLFRTKIECKFAALSEIDISEEIKKHYAIIENEFGGIVIDSILYRVVHGGSDYRNPQEISGSVLDAIDRYAEIAPLHNTVVKKYISCFQQKFSNSKHVAVFDTSFHKTIPDVAAIYAIPSSISEKYEIRRYGFHGLAHQSAAEKIKDEFRDNSSLKHINCHLGSGSSICAIYNGESLDCSMGFTPLEGLMMGTRSGDIDPGLLLYLLRRKEFSVDSLSDILNHTSGLLGVSELSSDMQELEKSYLTNQKAHLAIEMYCYRVIKYIGAFAGVLGGLDVLTFSGGVGENSTLIQQKIQQQILKFIPQVVSKPIKVDEELQMYNLYTSTAVDPFR
jgi:acetate kinase